MKIHVLSGGLNNSYEIVVHTATPAGNNSAGFAWSTVLVAARKPVSRLTVGTGPGQTTQAEVDGVLAGTIIEYAFRFVDNPAWTTTQRNTALDAVADQVIAISTQQLGDELKWYGATRA